MTEKTESVGQDSEILQMMASYRSHPLRDFVGGTPWMLISVVVHLAFVILAAYINW